jgi:hypothetical protein
MKGEEGKLQWTVSVLEFALIKMARVTILITTLSTEMTGRSPRRSGSPYASSGLSLPLPVDFCYI